MNSLKSRAMNCGPLSVMTRGVRELFPGSLQHDFDVLFGHALAQFPVDDESAAAIQHAHQIVKRAADVDVADIDVPVLVWP
jgi:hypothetical protein